MITEEERAKRKAAYELAVIVHTPLRKAASPVSYTHLEALENKSFGIILRNMPSRDCAGKTCA